MPSAMAIMKTTSGAMAEIWLNGVSVQPTVPTVRTMVPKEITNSTRAKNKDRRQNHRSRVEMMITSGNR